MSSLRKDLIHLIMQFLDEERYKDVLHTFEKESGIYFDSGYFDELVMGGKWEEAEKYISGFTKFDDNRHSMKIYFELRKQKYLEALDKNDRATALNILVKELKFFATFNEGLYKEMTQLLTKENLREHHQLTNYKDAETARASVLPELKRLINGNPLLNDKLEFPDVKDSRLQTLMNQSLNWQHSLCKDNRAMNPEIRTLLLDHVCKHHSSKSAVSSGSARKSDGKFLAIGPPGAGQTSQGSTAIATSRAHGETEAALMKALCAGVSDNFSGESDPNGDEEIPRSVTRVIVQRSATTSMDFHPSKQTLLLVGNSDGEILLWDVGSAQKLATRTLQPGLVKDHSVSVKRVLWTPDGNTFGAAFSKDMIQIYRYRGGSDIRKHLEFKAHVGSVNDIAFCNPNKPQCAITCGDDKLIKVWDVASGALLQVFEGHVAPVTSVCPHKREHIHFLLSTSADGKIKAWLFDEATSRVDFDSSGRACTMMRYTEDGKRLFSCGTSENGVSHILEWKEAEGTVTRAYEGLLKPSISVIQFDIAKNQFLAAGNDYLIKVWDINNVNMLTTIDAEGDLPASPRIRFNKAGSLMAVSTKENKIKILATPEGHQLLQTTENRSLVVTKIETDQTGTSQNGPGRNIKEENLNSSETETKPANLSDITGPDQLQSLRVTASKGADSISKLIFSNKGNAIIALALNGVHLLWTWRRTGCNLSGKGTTKEAPVFMEPPKRGPVTNKLRDARAEDMFSCFTLSKNDCYVISASGGRISLFSMLSGKTMSSFMCPPPKATCLTFHPRDNNIIAVGLEDNTIRIYNVSADKEIERLVSHTERITGVAFSNALDVLVSGGADGQVAVWGSELYELRRCRFVHSGSEKSPDVLCNTQVQFHPDQTHFLVAHELLIAIYDARDLDFTYKWVPGSSSPPVMQALLSSDGDHIFALCYDGVISVLATAGLHRLCLINPTAYLPPQMTSGAVKVVAENPQVPNMLAVGLSDGSVVVLEPLEAVGQWGVPPMLPNLAAPMEVDPVDEDVKPVV